MEREILFRGKRLSTNEWVYGDLLTTQVMEDGTEYTRYEIRAIKPNFGPIYFTVDGRTVGQCTGLKDCYGVKIFENDIVWLDDEKANYQVKHGQYGSFLFIDSSDAYYFYEVELRGCRVVGNVFDNPELAKEL